MDNFRKKFFDVIITEGGIISQNVLHANLIKYLLVSTFNTKVKEIEDKIPDISNLVNKTQLITVENTLVKKTEFNTELKNINYNVTSNKNEIKKLQSPNYSKGKNIVEQNYLVYVPINKCFNKTDNTENISSWKSKGISDDLIKTLYNNCAPKLLNPYLSAMPIC